MRVEKVFTTIHLLVAPSPHSNARKRLPKTTAGNAHYDKRACETPSKIREAERKHEMAVSFYCCPHFERSVLHRFRDVFHVRFFNVLA